MRGGDRLDDLPDGLLKEWTQAEKRELELVRAQGLKAYRIQSQGLLKFRAWIDQLVREDNTRRAIEERDQLAREYTGGEW